MRVIMFKDQFAELVRDGRKRQTIREHARCKSGDKLSLRRWSGKAYRSKQEVIREAVCTAVVPVTIFRTHKRIDLGGLSLSQAEAERFARDDGFENLAKMIEFFDNVGDLPFTGEVIQWKVEEVQK